MHAVASKRCSINVISLSFVSKLFSKKFLIKNLNYVEAIKRGSGSLDFSSLLFKARIWPLTCKLVFSRQTGLYRQRNLRQELYIMQMDCNFPGPVAIWGHLDKSWSCEFQM
jgi:hypothetical protein